jgi:DNA replication protein DnaC
LSDSKKKAEVAKLRSASGLGKIGLTKTFESFEVNDDNQQAVGVLDEWLDNDNPHKAGLMLFGPTGVGKTHLACAAANWLLERRVFCRYLRTVDIPREDTDAVRELADCGWTPWLVLDDLGAEKMTERALECLYLVLDGRLWHRAPTIITTNFTPTQLRKMLNAAEAGQGDRLVGRLNELCKMVPLGGEDRRS